MGKTSSEIKNRWNVENHHLGDRDLTELFYV